MSFKIAPDDFTLLNKYVEAKGKGCTLKIDFYGQSQKMYISLLTTTGEDVTITLYEESLNKFPEVTKVARLGDEIKR